MKSSHSAHVALLALCALSFLPFLSSCGDDPSDPGGNVDANIGIGSTFTLAAYYTDSDGAIIESSRDTVISTLTKIHPTLKGQSNVYEFTSKFGSTYLAYGSNGDLQLLFQVSLNSGVKDSVWLRLPVSSGDEVSQELTRNQQANGPAVVISTTTYNAKRTGTDNMTVGSKSLTVQQTEATIELKTEYVINGAQQESFSIYNNIAVDYAPEINYPTLQKTSITDDEGGSAGPGSYAVLIDYDLK